MSRRESDGRAAPALCACALFLLEAAPALAQQSLRSRIDFAVGQRPVAVIAADLDGDGLLDLASANKLSNDLSLLKGFGDGTFRVVASPPAGQSPSGLAYVDVTGDGLADLITANLRSRDVFVLPGDGLGGFGAPISSPAGAGAFGFTLGDWDGDGRLDVAIIDTGTNGVTRLLGDGAGGFVSPLQFSTGSSPTHILSDDLNGDGHLDLAVVNNLSATLQIFRGDGTGQFNLATTLPTGSAPESALAADFNGDAVPDLAVSNNGSNTVSIFLGDQSGGYAAPVLLAPGFGPSALVAADVDQDQDLDLVVTLSKVLGIGKVAVMLGDGAGGFAQGPTLGTGPVPEAVAVADVNGDGHPDLIVASLTGNSVAVIPSLAAGSFLTSGRIDLPVGTFPHGVIVADFNGDADPDVATANSAMDNVSVATGDGTGGFTSVNSANNTGITPFSIAAADFDLDGDLDLVTANNGDDTLSYLQGSGAGNFTVTNGIAVGCDPVEGGVVSVSAGEISGDGLVDLAFVCEVSDEFCSLRGTGGSGASAFGAPVCSAVGRTPQGVALGNYTLDALEDPAVTSSALDLVQIGISDGFGGFLDIPADFPVGDQPKGVVRGDLNGDGFLDLVVADTGAAGVSALLGDGGGVFSFPSIDTAAGAAPTALALADFDLDGNLDVAVTNTNGNNVSLLLGDGLGHFSNAGDFGTRDLPIAVGAGDFNRDGKPDLAVADNFSDTVTILLNETIPGDPLAFMAVFGGTRTVLRWGLVPGAAYDLIRGRILSVAPGPAAFDLGPVTCLADDLPVTDTAAAPDESAPPPGDAYFYVVRPVVGGVPGEYTVSTDGRPGIPSSGGCP
ncbi:MAG: FG-GAP repeat domain-containing protein [Acidobacteriota bacterium]